MLNTMSTVGGDDEEKKRKVEELRKVEDMLAESGPFPPSWVSRATAMC
jgi:hypothetical protein